MENKFEPRTASKMHVGLVQMDCALSDVEKNLSYVLEQIEENRGKVDFLVFPELTLTGYNVGSTFHECSMRTDSEPFHRLVEATKDITVAVGFVEETDSFSFFNSLALIRDKKVISIHRKIYLPNYGIFEERKHFSPGSNYVTVMIEKFRVAPFICGDAWNPAFVHLAAADLANVIVFSVCSPEGGLGSRLSSKENWKRLCRFYASIYGCYVIFVNRVGSEQHVRFWGESEVIDPFGSRIAGFDGDEEGVVSAEVHLEEVRNSRTLIHTVRDEDFNFLQRRLERVMRLRYE